MEKNIKIKEISIKYSLLTLFPAVLLGLALAEIFPKYHVNLGLMNVGAARIIAIASFFAIFCLTVIRIIKIKEVMKNK